MIRWFSIILNYFRLTYGYKIVGMMPYEKLTKRDKNQLRFPFETVRIRYSGSNYIGVYKECFEIYLFLIYLSFSYTGGGTAILAVSSLVLFVSITQLVE